MADEVFPLGKIHGDFAAHRAVDHREHGRGDLDEVQTALEGCRDKTREVSDNAAAECDDRRVARQPELGHFTVELRGDLETFCAFTVVDHKDVRGVAALFERSLHGG